MNNTKDIYKPTISLGVVIGRFQIDNLHKGHVDFLTKVSQSNTYMLVILGLSPCKCTMNNPLDFAARKRMVSEYFPDAIVRYVNDQFSDEVWSENVDTVVSETVRDIQVAKFIKDFDSITLFGSRDSFIKYYSGKYNTQELKPRIIISATELRKRIGSAVRNSKDFRAGVIWAMINQWARSLPTVDVAVINKETGYVLLGRKPKEDKYRLVGGFVTPGETWEFAASRELKEETNIFAAEENLTYERSFFIDDWRYKKEKDKITTTLFTAFTWEGNPEPADDICELQWFQLDMQALPQIMPNHVDMFTYLVNKYGDK